MLYNRQMRVEFNHCDPAGIVFYPRYFEMTNSLAENFFRDVVDFPYEAMMAMRQGVPTARIDLTFHAPSRLGEVLDWQLRLIRLGGSSLDVTIETRCQGERRLSGTQTLVQINEKGRPLPWSEEIRARITAFMEAT